MSQTPAPHTSTTLQEWTSTLTIITSPHKSITVDGTSLDLAKIVALETVALDRLNSSARLLERDLEKGKTVYGVNTGPGGSANTRTRQVEGLQESLVALLQCGTIYPSSESGRSQSTKENGLHACSCIELLRNGLLVEDPIAANSMPESWTRAAILIRINSLMRGISSVRPVIVHRLAELLHFDIIPRIPIHGSISASGDLSPASYIAGCIQGKSNISVTAGKERRIVPAHVAIAEAGLSPVSLAAKEGLAIVNGTAFSAGVGALVMHDACGLGVLAQVLSAMSVEALVGSVESFHPYFAAVRAHPGQIESAQNIFHFLGGSRLTRTNDGRTAGSLRQDRYSIRTASQWIGPVLEDFDLAYHRVFTECNSVTDNPLITPGGEFLQGGNFQAKVVTSAMEKTRQGFQSLGRMLFAQCSELINPATSDGLPPNLSADPPSESFIMKGVDVLCASQVSELGFLANPVGSHVQTAEMGNQALNSLALISARYTRTAADLLSRLSAAHLLVVCQALDLRAMQSAFLSALEIPFQTLTSQAIGPICKIPDIHDLLWPALLLALDNSTIQDPAPRFESIASLLQSIILPFIDAESNSSCISSLFDWTHGVAKLLHTSHESTFAAYLNHGDASALLGHAARRMYLFVRKELKVPFLHERMLHASLPGIGDHEPDANFRRQHMPTIGDYITILHEAICQGVLFIPAMEALKEARDAVSIERSESNHVEPCDREIVSEQQRSEGGDIPSTTDVKNGLGELRSSTDTGIVAKGSGPR